MKSLPRHCLILSIALLALTAGVICAAPVGTAFTYQGRLTDGGQPATGIYDLRFTICDDAATGSAVAGPLTMEAVGVTNGLFTLPLDFGLAVFDGEKRWLELAVRANGVTGDFTVLTPRQCLTPVPYAISASALAGAGGAPLALTVAGLPALRLEPALTSPNLVGGYEGNSVAPGVSGAVIAGGGTRRDSPGENGGPEPNTITGNYAFIGAGFGNELAGSASAIVAGRWNSLSLDAWDSFIGGGNGNHVESPFSAIPGGGGNSIGVLSLGGFVGGGLNNRIGTSVDCAAIGGGRENLVQEGSSLGIVGGGLQNIMGGSPYSVIAGGRYNSLWGGSTDITIGGGQSNVVQEHAYGATIAGGRENTVGGSGSGSAIGGGLGNTVSGGSYGSTIGGGRGNAVSGGSGYATIAGGIGNGASGYAATASGGENNTSSGYQAAVGGGSGNTSSGDNATVAGGRLNLSQGEGATVGGGANNVAWGEYGTIGGGLFNSNATFAGTVAGGSRNVNLGMSSTVGGGGDNLVHSNAAFATIGGGGFNFVGGFGATVAGGGGGFDEPVGNGALGDWSTVSGGRGNSAGDHFASVGGGENNFALGRYAVVPGGMGNTAQGQFSFAAGENAMAEHDGAFVWADASFSGVLRSTATNQFTARAAGGVRFFSDAQATTGAELAPGSGSWSTLSDRAAKDDLCPVDGRAVLEQLARVPLSTWRYRTQAPGVRHVGPMAQDFAAAFGVGEDERHISSVDADGVALAAIQGLNEVVKEKDAKIADLEKRLVALEELLKGRVQSGNEKELK